MVDIGKAILIAIYYFLCFFILGSSLLRILKLKFSAALALVTGGISYYIFFNLIALPMKLLFCPLSLLTRVWCGLVLVGMMMLMIFGRKNLGDNLREMKKQIEKAPKFYLCFFALFLVQYLYIGCVTPMTAGVTDDRYYIGDVMTSLYTNTIQQYDYLSGGLNGGKLEYLDTYYLLQMYPIHMAVVSQVTGLHPLIENKWVLTGIWLILIDCVYLLWGEFLFRDDKKKILSFLLIVTWCAYAMRLVTESLGQHLIYRMAEGKNLLANFIVPFLFYLFTRIVKNGGDYKNWFLLFWTVLGSYALVMSSLFILPLVLGSFYACHIIIGKRWKYLAPAALCYSPCVAVLVIYVLEISGKLLFRVP